MNGRVTFSRIIADHARVDPGRPLVIDADGELIASELDRAATSLAHALIRHGVTIDDTVSVTLPNSRDFIIACTGIWRAGATPQPISPHLTAEEREQLEHLSRPVATIGTRPATPGGAWLPSARVAPDASPLPGVAASCWKASATSGSTGRPKVVRAAAPALLDRPNLSRHSSPALPPNSSPAPCGTPPYSPTLSADCSPVTSLSSCDASTRSSGSTSPRPTTPRGGCWCRP